MPNQQRTRCGSRAAVIACRTPRRVIEHEGTDMNEMRVAVNGYGVIGKRVADAVRMQPDMRLVGVADVAADWRIQTATVLGIPVYAADGDAGDRMRQAGLPVAGEFDDLSLIHI